MFEDAPNQSPQQSSPKNNTGLPNFASKLPQLIGVLILVVAIGAAGFFFVKYQSEKTRAAQLLGASTESSEDVKKLIDSVGKLVELPKGEQPTVATVSNKEKLSGQAFFANAQNGDKVLIYNKARVAVLYRPSTGKIVNYATNITVGGESASTNPAPTGEVEATPSVEPTIEPTVVPTVQAKTIQPTTEPTVSPAE